MANRSQSDHLQRISTSCPSLCPIISIDGIVQSHHHTDQDGGSDPDLLTNCSTNSSPTHYTGPGQGIQGIDRRRSWTDLEDSRHRTRSDSTQHLQPDAIVSLSYHFQKYNG